MPKLWYYNGIHRKCMVNGGNIMNEDFDFKIDDFGEWIDDMGPYIPDVKSICLNCGLEETIPDFIYDEMGGKAKHKELKTEQKVSTIYCNRCGKFKTVSKYWLNHE